MHVPKRPEASHEHILLLVLTTMSRNSIEMGFNALLSDSLSRHSFTLLVLLLVGKSSTATSTST